MCFVDALDLGAEEFRGGGIAKMCPVCPVFVHSFSGLRDEGRDQLAATVQAQSAAKRKQPSLNLSGLTANSLAQKGCLERKKEKDRFCYVSWP